MADKLPKYAGHQATEIIAESSHAIVYGATPPEPGPPTVLKCILVDSNRDRIHQARILNEAFIASSLNHPTILPIIAHGEMDEETCVIVSPYIDGITLDDLIAHRERIGEPLPLTFILEILRQAAEGLDYAYTTTDPRGRALKFTHRNLKPSNVFLHRDGHVLLTDFGLHHGWRAQPADADAQAYQAPELVAGAPIDTQADMYSLGILMARLLQAGTGSTEKEITEGFLEDRRKIDAIPSASVPTIARVLRRLREPNPADRPSSMHEVLLELAEIALPLGKAPKLDAVVQECAQCIALRTRVKATLADAGASHEAWNESVRGLLNPLPMNSDTCGSSVRSGDREKAGEPDARGLRAGVEKEEKEHGISPNDHSPHDSIHSMDTSHTMKPATIPESRLQPEPRIEKSETRGRTCTGDDPAPVVKGNEGSPPTPREAGSMPEHAATPVGLGWKDGHASKHGPDVPAARKQGKRRSSWGGRSDFAAPNCLISPPRAPAEQTGFSEKDDGRIDIRAAAARFREARLARGAGTIPTPSPPGTKGDERGRAGDDHRTRRGTAPTEYGHASDIKWKNAKHSGAGSAGETWPSAAMEPSVPGSTKERTRRGLGAFALLFTGEDSPWPVLTGSFIVVLIMGSVTWILSGIGLASSPTFGGRGDLPPTLAAHFSSPSPERSHEALLSAIHKESRDVPPSLSASAETNEGRDSSIGTVSTDEERALEERSPSGFVSTRERADRHVSADTPCPCGPKDAGRFPRGRHPASKALARGETSPSADSGTPRRHASRNASMKKHPARGYAGRTSSRKERLSAFTGPSNPSRKALRRKKITADEARERLNTEGRLSVRADPPCAVYIDGIPVAGRTPLNAVRIPAGRHDIVLEAEDGRRRGPFSLVIRPGEHTIMDPIVFR